MSQWENKIRRERPSCDGALFVSSLAPERLAHLCQRTPSGSHVSWTLAHTHRALFYLSGCSLLSIWLDSLCLSACPPHKPNNVTLLRLLEPWPAAQWKKRRRTYRGGKGRGKWGKEKVTHGHKRLAEAEIGIWASGLGRSEGPVLSARSPAQPSPPTNSYFKTWAWIYINHWSWSFLKPSITF